MIVVENRAAFDDHRVTKQIETLIQRGYHVYVITMRHRSNRRYSAHPLVHLYEYPPPPEPASMPAYFVEYGYSFLAATFLSLRVARQERIDVVQFCQPPDIYFPLAGMLRRLGVRVVVLDQRDLLPELYVARYGRSHRWMLSAIERIERRSQRNADRIITVSDVFRKRLVAATGVPEDRVSIVGNGPVLARVAGAQGDPALKRGHRYLCCWVGVVARQDRVDLLVRSIDHLVHELGRNDCQFVIIGYGDFLAEAKALVREKNLTDWVQFTGQVDQAEVFRYLATADVGLDASLQHEVSPVKAIEYMAFGLPFVAFDLPGTRAISDGAAAYVDPGDVVAHAKAIDALLRNAKRRKELGKAGQARVAEDLAWDHQALTYVRLMEELCLDGAGT
jgi:glycosyltransferase involved in cell wall biosynthesis